LEKGYCGTLTREGIKEKVAFIRRAIIVYAMTMNLMAPSIRALLLVSTETVTVMGCIF
jgi:hypothetical protein